MRPRLRNALLLATVMAIAGCNAKPSSGVGSPPVLDDGGTVEAVPAVQGEMAGVVEQLKQLATNVKLDADGFVTEVDFRGTTLDDDAVMQLAGLNHLQSLLLNETMITDVGLAFVGRIKSLRNLDLRGCPSRTTAWHISASCRTCVHCDCPAVAARRPSTMMG